MTTRTWRWMAIGTACAMLAGPAFAQQSDEPLPTPGASSALVTSAGIQPTPSIVAMAAREAATELPRPTLDEQTAPPPRAVDYSDAYRLRAKIHRVSSFATLPLFGAEAVIGQSLYSDPTSGKKDAHLVAAAGIGALFAVNTVTGVWNLIEGRHDPNGGRRRWVHGLLMLAADGGFLATAALGPSSEHGEVEGSRATHRAVAFASIGLATTSYLVMLLGGH